MKTISILNLKGGVAKTFTAANMAYEIYRRGYRVLLIDNDKQGNLSKAYSRYDAESVAPVTRLLAGDWQGATELIQNTNYVGQKIIFIACVWFFISKLVHIMLYPFFRCL